MMDGGTPMVINIHQREYDADAATIGALLDGLASPDDRLWPGDRWPAIRFDRPLGVGVRGGHGMIRYYVESYVPGQKILFRLTAPKGFDGTHWFEVEEVEPMRTRLRHTLEVRLSGTARLTWPLAIRWLHDALLEDALDRADAAVKDGKCKIRALPLHVKFLRRVLALLWNRKSKHGLPRHTGRAPVA
jgi:hypothetical protein